MFRKKMRKSQDEGLLLSHLPSKQKISHKSQSQSPNRAMFVQTRSSLVKQNKMTAYSNSIHNNFKLIYRIGFGGLGKVWKVVENSTSKEYAMKAILKKR